MKIIITSGYFSPAHIGHLNLLKECSKLRTHYGWVVVIVNSDKQNKEKSGYSFLDEETRLELVKNLKWVDDAMIAIDEDGSISKTLEAIVKHYKSQDMESRCPMSPELEFVFAKGGPEYSPETINKEELETCQRLGIKIIYNIGGSSKENSSSKILNNYYDWRRQKDLQIRLEKMKKAGILGKYLDY